MSNYFCSQLYSPREFSQVNNLFVNQDGVISIGEQTSSDTQLYEVNQKIIEYVNLVLKKEFNDVKKEFHNKGRDFTRIFIANLYKANSVLTLKNHGVIYNFALNIFNLLRSLFNQYQIANYKFDSFSSLHVARLLLFDNGTNNNVYRLTFGWNNDLDHERSSSINFEARTSDNRPLPEGFTNRKVKEIALDLTDSLDFVFDTKLFKISCEIDAETRRKQYSLLYADSTYNEKKIIVSDTFFRKTTKKVITTPEVRVRVKAKDSSGFVEEALSRDVIRVTNIKKGLSHYLFNEFESGEIYPEYNPPSSFLFNPNDEITIFSETGESLTFSIKE